jgi:hypothetical protein
VTPVVIDFYAEVLALIRRQALVTKMLDQAKARSAVTELGSWQLRRARSRRVWILGLLILAIPTVAAGCAQSEVLHGGPLRPPSFSTTSVEPSSPLSVTLGWFAAINRKDKSAALTDFEPSAADHMNWGNGDTSTWPTFSNLRCSTANETASTASVYCTFSESQAPAVGNPDSFWTVYLDKHPGGRWLINNHGQG